MKFIQKNILKSFILCCFMLFSSLISAQTLTITDDVGRKIELNGPVEKAVVANRYNNELIRAIGSIDKVISVDEYTAQDRVYWANYDMKDIIGKDELNYEKIIQLNPDVLIVPRNSNYEKHEEQLKKVGIKVIVVTGWDKDVQKQITLFGEIFGNEEGSKKLIEFYNEVFNSIESRISKVKGTKKVYWEYGKPFSTAIPGTSNDGWHNMILNGGGINIFGDPNLAGKEIDPEKILLENPDLIVKTASGKAIRNSGVYTGNTEEELSAVLEEMVSRPGWKDLKAVQNKDLYVTTGFAAGGLGKLVGTVYIAKWLFPDEMHDINPDDIFAQWMKMQGFDLPEGHNYRLK